MSEETDSKRTVLDTSAASTTTDDNDDDAKPAVDRKVHDIM